MRIEDPRARNKLKILPSLAGGWMDGCFRQAFSAVIAVDACQMGTIGKQT